MVLQVKGVLLYLCSKCSNEISQENLSNFLILFQIMTVFYSVLTIIVDCNIVQIKGHALVELHQK